MRPSADSPQEPPVGGVGGDRHGHRASGADGAAVEPADGGVAAELQHFGAELGEVGGSGGGGVRGSELGGLTGVGGSDGAALGLFNGNRGLDLADINKGGSVTGFLGGDGGPDDHGQDDEAPPAILRSRRAATLDGVATRSSVSQVFKC